MTLTNTITTIPELVTSTVIPLNGLFPFENTQLNQTQNTTLSTLLSYVEPKTKVYINNILNGTYPAINLIGGENIQISTTNNSNYLNVLLTSSIPNPLNITNVGVGLGIYKAFDSTYKFKTLIAGTNVNLVPDVNSITINVDTIGETNTVSTLGLGVSLFKQKVLSDLQFKSIVAGTNISIDTTNPNQIVINGPSAVSSLAAQNIGTGIGRIYANTLGSVLRFKTIKAGANILISDSPSEVIISSIGTGGNALNNTETTGSKLLNNSANIKRIIPGDGIIITDTEDSITLATNAGTDITNVGVGIPIYKGFNSLIDKHEFKTLKAQDGLIIESLNDNELVIRGNSTASIASTSTTNSLISSQVGSLTTLKTLGVTNPVSASIVSTQDTLSLNIASSANIWNANKINNVNITFPTSTISPLQESTLVYRGTEFVTGTPKNLTTKYIEQQSFGSYIPSNGNIFKISAQNTWTLAVLSDGSTPLINFLTYYLDNKLYLSNNIIDGLIGLTPSAIYYLTNNSTISTLASSVVIGVALSTTSLWFKPYAI